MCEPKRDILKQKLDHIRKDYDTGVSILLHNGDRVARIRTWSVTVFAAYLAYVLKSDDLTMVPLWPLIGAVVLFWTMEAFATSAAIFLRHNCLCRVDAVFDTTQKSKASGNRETKEQQMNETEEEEFWNKVEEYEFWRLQDKPFKSERPKEKEWSLKLWKPTVLRRMVELCKYKYSVPRRFVSGLVTAQALAFYFIPLVLLILLGTCRQSSAVSTQRTPATSGISLDLSDARPQRPTAREPLVLRPAPPH